MSARPTPPAPARRREAVIGAAVAALVLLAVAVVGVVGSRAGDGSTTASAAPSSDSGGATPSAAPSDAAVIPPPVMPEASGPTGRADELAVSLPAVSFDGTASGEDGIRAEVVSLEAIAGSGTGVGNVAGPALRVTVRLTGSTTEPVALDFVGATMTYGADRTPASPLDDPSAAPFTGTLEPGGTAEATYVFGVPEGERELVTLTVGYRADAPYLVFSGAAP